MVQFPTLSASQIKNSMKKSREFPIFSFMNKTWAKIDSKRRKRSWWIKDQLRNCNSIITRMKEVENAEEGMKWNDVMKASMTPRNSMWRWYVLVLKSQQFIHNFKHISLLLSIVLDNFLKVDTIEAMEAIDFRKQD
jgi:hypothetical protein